MYRDRVAVQLPSRVVLYELAAPADGLMGERPRLDGWSYWVVRLVWERVLSDWLRPQA